MRSKNGWILLLMLLSGIVLGGFLGMLTEEEKNEIRSMIFKDFDASSSHFTPGLRARYKSFRRKEEKKDGE